jgi:K+-transporting ATPase KdpF subunit
MPVSIDMYLGGLVSLALAIYLGYALFHPEKF